MNVTLNADQVLANYSVMLRQLAELTGFDPKVVLLGEAGVILKTCAGRTKVATVESIDRGTRLHVAHKLGLTGGVNRSSPVSINVGVRGSYPEGSVWLKTRNDSFQLAGHVDLPTGSVEWANLHFRGGDWSEIVKAVNLYRSGYSQRSPIARQAEGLARQSWVQIADNLGIDLTQVKGGGTLSAPGIVKAKAAIATTGLAYQNGQGRQFNDANRFFVELTNSLPFGDRLNFDGLLLYVLYGRVGLFQNSYARGAFDSLQRAGRNFPYLRITAPTGLEAA